MAPQVDAKKNDKNAKKNNSGRNKSGAQHAGLKMAEPTPGSSNTDVKTNESGPSTRSREHKELNKEAVQANEGNKPEKSEDVDMSNDDDSSMNGEPSESNQRGDPSHLADDMTFPSLNFGKDLDKMPFNWADEVKQSELEEVKKSIAKVVNTAENAASALEGLVYDYYDKAARIEDQENDMKH